MVLPLAVGIKLQLFSTWPSAKVAHFEVSMRAWNRAESIMFWPAGTLRQSIVDRPGALSTLSPEWEQKQGRPPTILTICLLGHSAQDCAVLVGRDSDDRWEIQEGRKGIWDVGQELIRTDDLGWLTQWVSFPFSLHAPSLTQVLWLNHLFVQNSNNSFIVRINKMSTSRLFPD